MRKLVVSSCSVVIALMFSASVRVNAQTLCDRACLIGIADSYFAAFAAHDPSKAPLAPKMNLVERSDTAPVDVFQGGNLVITQQNLAVTAVTKSLLNTITEEPASFRIYVPDTVSQEIGGLAMIKLGDRPTEVGFHMKVDNRRITDAELVFVRISDPSALENLRTPRPELPAAVPTADRLSRDILQSFAYSTYDANTQDVRAVPLAENCARRDNGTAVPIPSCGRRMTTTEVSLIDGGSLHRVRLADPETGLVFSLVYNYVGAAPGTNRVGSFAAAYINKVRGSRVVSSEAMGFGPVRGSQVTLARSGPAAVSLRDWTAFTH